MIRKSLLNIFIILLTFLFKDAVFAEEQYDFTMRIGVGFKRDSLNLNLDSYDSRYPDQETETLSATMLSYKMKVTGEVTITLAPRFFKQSGFGWDLAFALSEFTTTAQHMNAESGEMMSPELVDLGTYSTGEVFYITPRLFYAFGHNDDTPKEYFTIGIGMGLGTFNVKGTAYLTHGEVAPSCKQAVEDRNANAIKQNCSFASFEENWLPVATSVSSFIMYRSGYFYASIESNSLVELKPVQMVSPDYQAEYSPGMFQMVTGIVIDF